MSRARDYVTGYFSTEEKAMFNYLVATFPESILVQSGVESEDILALLGLIAKTLGNSKELINNLAISHSVIELYNKISIGYLAANNEKLLLLMADELNIPLFVDKTDTEKLELLADQNIKELVMNSYLLTKDRGTVTAIKNIIKYAISLAVPGKTTFQKGIEVRTDPAGHAIIIMENDGMEEVIDYESTSNIFSEPDNNPTIYMRTDNELHKLLMYYRPAGVYYDILIEYIANLLMNSNNDTLINSIESEMLSNNIDDDDDVLFFQVEAINLLDPNTVTVITLPTYSVNGPLVTYQATIKNLDPITTLRFHLTSDIDPVVTDIIIKPNETKVISNSSVNPDFVTTAKAIGYFKNQYGINNTHDGQSIPWELVINGGFTPGTVTLSDFSLARSQDGTKLNITNPNAVSVDAIISETWYYDKGNDNSYSYVYLDRPNIKRVGIAAGQTYQHSIVSPSSEYILDVKFTVERAA
jgi:hypothetical protein